MVTQPNTPATSPTRLVNSQRAGRTTTRSTTPAAATRNHATIVGGKRSNSPTARAAPAYSDSPEAIITAGAVRRCLMGGDYNRTATRTIHPRSQLKAPSMRTSKTNSAILRPRVLSFKASPVGCYDVFVPVKRFLLVTRQGPLAVVVAVDVDEAVAFAELRGRRGH